MKATLAVIVAFVFFILGWFFLVGLLYVIGYVASHARGGMGLMHFLHILLMWVLGPGFGGFLATYVTPRIFNEVHANTIATSFISVVITLAVIIVLVSLVFVQQEKSGIGEFVLFVVQVAAIVVGATIGNSMHVSSNT